MIYLYSKRQGCTGAPDVRGCVGGRYEHAGLVESLGGDWDFYEKGRTAGAIRRRLKKFLAAAPSGTPYTDFRRYEAEAAMSELNRLTWGCK